MHLPLGLAVYRRPHAPPPQARQSVQLLNSSPEVIRLVVMMYLRFPLSLRNVDDLLIELRIYLCHETVSLRLLLGLDLGLISARRSF